MVSLLQLEASLPAILAVPSLPDKLVLDVDFATLANTGFGNVTGVLIPAGFGATGAVAGHSNGCNANGTSDFGAVAAAADAGFRRVCGSLGALANPHRLV